MGEFLYKRGQNGEKGETALQMEGSGYS